MCGILGKTKGKMWQKHRLDILQIPPECLDEMEAMVSVWLTVVPEAQNQYLECDWKQHVRTERVYMSE
jgi:hypothetical protein